MEKGEGGEKRAAQETEAEKEECLFPSSHLLLVLLLLQMARLVYGSPPPSFSFFFFFCRGESHRNAGSKKEKGREMGERKRRRKSLSLPSLNGHGFGGPRKWSFSWGDH